MSIKSVLMERDGMTEEEAEDLIQEGQEEFLDLIAQGRLEEAYYICQDFFGLEPDFLEEML